MKVFNLSFGFLTHSFQALLEVLGVFKLTLRLVNSDGWPGNDLDEVPVVVEVHRDLRPLLRDLVLDLSVTCIQL